MKGNRKISRTENMMIELKVESGDFRFYSAGNLRTYQKDVKKSMKKSN